MGTSVGRNSNRMFCFEVVCINVVFCGVMCSGESVYRQCFSEYIRPQRAGQVKILPGHGGNIEPAAFGLLVQCSAN